MGKGMKKICKAPNCDTLTTNKSGYCDAHASRQRRPQDTDSFYKSKDWTTASREYRAARPMCEICRERPARLVHHKVSLRALLASGRDPLDWSYLQSTCSACHERAHDRVGRNRSPHRG